MIVVPGMSTKIGQLRRIELEALHKSAAAGGNRNERAASALELCPQPREITGRSTIAAATDCAQRAKTHMAEANLRLVVSVPRNTPTAASPSST
jgi:DNA-directed RNA polymerase sigma subunit (sigma70/sigma32)